MRYYIGIVLARRTHMAEAGQRGRQEMESTHTCGGNRPSGSLIDGDPICQACLREAGLSEDAAAAVSAVVRYSRVGPPGSWEHREVAKAALRAALAASGRQEEE